jgi:MYXO-CTERM domain-containing protein
MPAGLTVTSSAATWSGPGDPAPSFTVTASTPGTYVVNINATSGLVTNMATVTVTVVAPDFALGVTPATQSFASEGGAGKLDVSVTARGDFAGPVTLTVAATPAGLVATPASATVSPGASGYPQTACDLTAAVAGTYTVTITGTSGSLVHTATATVTAKAPDFSLAVSPNKTTAMPNAMSMHTITLAPLDGWSATAPVTLMVMKPAAVTATLGQSSVGVPGSTTLMLSSAAVGNYTVTVVAEGTSNGTLARHAAAVEFSVNMGGGCSGNCDDPPPPDGGPPAPDNGDPDGGPPQPNNGDPDGGPPQPNNGDSPDGAPANPQGFRLGPPPPPPPARPAAGTTSVRPGGAGQGGCSMAANPEFPAITGLAVPVLALALALGLRRRRY